MLLVTKTSTRYKILRTVCHCGSVCVVAELPCAAFNFFNLFTFLLTKFQKMIDLLFFPDRLCKYIFRIPPVSYAL